MKQLFLTVLLFSVLAVAFTQSQPNTLQLADSYNWATSVTQKIKDQIATSLQAIKDLQAAVDKANTAQVEAYNQWQQLVQIYNQAKLANDQAKQQKNQLQQEWNDTKSVLAAAQATLDAAVAESQAKNADFAKKDSVYQTASKLRDVESPSKKKEIVEFCRAIQIVGSQHQIGTNECASI
jgi:chromosome segregation ATPase